jgi:hypothetical protein
MESPAWLWALLVISIVITAFLIYNRATSKHMGKEARKVYWWGIAFMTLVDVGLILMIYVLHTIEL